MVDDLVHQFTPKNLHHDQLEIFHSNDKDEVLDLDDIKMVKEAFENAIEKERPPWSHQVEKLPTNNGSIEIKDTKGGEPFKIPANRSRVASSSSAARQTARQPVRQSEPNVPMAFNPQYHTLHEHLDDIRLAGYEHTHPITGFIVM
ncbi:unnamed protein product [Lactuca saligna]|uniref:Uncharacterized protein n=1 Tax=Lactuca saligna TaxID=75948 RepID=A0AA36E3F5_LACSI|nr:unnamed protein product [Lactuca saligna]